MKERSCERAPAQSTLTPQHWDSDFFGFPVCRLNIYDKSDDLEYVASDLKRRKFRLCYIFCHCAEAALSAKAIGATQVDMKTVLEKPVANSSLGSAESTNDIALQTDRTQLLELALQSGEMSRFKVDPKMPEGKWRDMYSLWIDNSLSGAMADTILVERIERTVVGMISLKREQNIGEIGLFAVDQSVRGQGVGNKLLERSNRWHIDNGCSFGRVTTQGNNAAALHVYVKHGYKVVSQTPILHLWL
jgi:dTDP-4-amino-4,6-dideoxy-D-galactose acyltransferase